MAQRKQYYFVKFFDLIWFKVKTRISLLTLYFRFCLRSPSPLICLQLICKGIQSPEVPHLPPPPPHHHTHTPAPPLISQSMPVRKVIQSEINYIFPQQMLYFVCSPEFYSGSLPSGLWVASPSFYICTCYNESFPDIIIMGG